MPEHPRNVELAGRAIDLLSARDYDGLRAMCAPDVRLEMPYHPQGAQTRHGVDILIKEFRVLNGFAAFRVDLVQTFDTGGDDVIVEARSHGTSKTGLPDYNNHYLFVLSFGDGKLVQWREFYNPLEAMKQNYGKPRPAKVDAAQEAEVR